MHPFPVSAAAHAASHTHYRADIDGLRAVAVLSVLLFHAFPQSMPGGFIGVDIFFVISGFLITGILLNSLETRSFSLAEFYYRRIRRIFPALLLVLAACLAFGGITLVADEYSQLGKHIGAGATFVSNLVLWSESGYFDNQASTKPLLHLWSLAVEEQFYLVWPLLLWVAWKYRLSALWLSLGIIVVSFALSTVLTATHQSAAFYFPITRFWEILTGSALACLPLATGNTRRTALTRLRGSTALSALGLGLILGGLFVIREDHFPGWWALMPVAGAACCILAGPTAWVNRTLLASRPMVWVGLLSYPLYLWHWPLLSFARILQGDPSATARWVLLGLSFVLAWLTYRFVETPIRLAKGHRAWIATPLLTGMILLGSAGMAIFLSGGLPQRTVAQQTIDIQAAGFDGGWPGGIALSCDNLSPRQNKLFTCVTDSREAPRLALVGDSKAGALFQGLYRTSQPGGTWLYLGSGNSGPLVTVLSDDPLYKGYSQDAVQEALSLLAGMDRIDTVVIAVAARALFQLPDDDSIRDLPSSPNGAVAAKGLDRFVKALLEQGKQVVLLVDNPTLPHMQDCIVRQTGNTVLDRFVITPPHPDCIMPLSRYQEDARQYLALLSDIQARYPDRVRIYDATPVLCEVDQGLCTPFKDGRLMYGITDHISDIAATHVAQGLQDFLNRSAP